VRERTGPIRTGLAWQSLPTKKVYRVGEEAPGTGAQKVTGCELYDEEVSADGRLFWALVWFSMPALGQSYFPPAGIRPAKAGWDASILPGGRIIAPTGEQYPAGAGPFGLALSESGNTLVSANVGPGDASLTILTLAKTWALQQLAAGTPNEPGGSSGWRSVSMGIAFSGERAVFVSEGASGRVALVDLDSGERRRAIDINQGGYPGSFSGDLALDPVRNVLYVADLTHARIAVVDARSRQVLASAGTGWRPFVLTLSPDRRTLYVANAGMFHYQTLASRLFFPPFGFPSTAAGEGVQITSGPEIVKVPGLGDPNGPEANSVCVIDVSVPAMPKTEAFIRTGRPLGATVHSGSSPSGIAATADRVYVANAAQDSISVIDARRRQVINEIPIRIPALPHLRGVIPIGLAYHEKTGWLLVAEAGLNAVGVIDTHTGEVLGHIPAGWYPTRVLVARDTVFVANMLGAGTGPNAISTPYGLRLLAGEPDRGSISIYRLPPTDSLAASTAFVLRADGFIAGLRPSPVIPNGIRHLVLIIKTGQPFDQVLGDLTDTGNGSVLANPALAHLGRSGSADGGQERLSLHGVNLTPNLHAIAGRWSLYDNFYADSSQSATGQHWLAGSYPLAWTAFSLAAGLTGARDMTPEDRVENGTIWAHLAEHNTSFYNFGGWLGIAGAIPEQTSPTALGFTTNMPLPEELYMATSRSYPGWNPHLRDTERADRFVHEIDERFVRTGEDLPQLISLYLPNDGVSQRDSQAGYPYAESFVADNDLALGRVVAYLSKTRWWRSMTVMITEDSAQDGADHIDSHRTVLICAGPWAKRRWVSHTNSSFPGLIKTIEEVFRLPVHNLFDASAASLSGCFTSEPDFTGYTDIRPDARVYQETGSR
jgi:YVTN family beta-propeller protein